MLTYGQMVRMWARYIYPKTMRRKPIMTTKTRMETLVADRELYDITPICTGVFGKDVCCFIVAHLFETLEFYSRQMISDGGNAITAMLDEIKADCMDAGFVDGSSIIGFLAQKPGSFFCSEIFGLPGFYVWVCTVPELPAILIGDNCEVLEHIVGVIHTDVIG